MNPLADRPDADLHQALPTADQVRRLLFDEQLQQARDAYSATISTLLTGLADWLGVDSWLGAGHLPEHSAAVPSPAPTGDAKASYLAFRGVATVLGMTAELAETAVVMTTRRRSYAVGAVVRQLIECEYLLTLFDQDLEHAAQWIRSSPAEIRQAFSPAQMRTRTGTFSNQEYWRHCDAGGHPAPKGAPLLEKLDPTRQRWPLAAAELAVDLGLHLQRVWRAVDRVLATQHARYINVRAEQRQQASDAWTTWTSTDPVVALLPALSASRLTGSPQQP